MFLIKLGSKRGTISNASLPCVVLSVFVDINVKTAEMELQFYLKSMNSKLSQPFMKTLSSNEA